MKITQHIPSFIDTDVPTRVADFESTDELLKVPWVAQWAKSYHKYGFYVSYSCLMIDGIRYNGKREWWVIGYLDDPDQVDLPTWKAP